MTATLLPFSLPGCHLDQARQNGNTLLLIAHADQLEAACPQCGLLSTSIHSYYTRAPTDLPISDQAVRLVLHVRRFRCHNPVCPKRTFAERLPDLLLVRARRTLRLEKAQSAVGFALGGQAGARLLRLLHMPTSPDALLRMMRRRQVAPAAAPRVLGVDDWAYRKGKRYGTILVDLEAHQVIDLLEDRTADTLANWLRAHPGVEIIARDRSTEYARGASEAAPEAIQVADRWHLLHNLHQMLERFFRRIHSRLAALPVVANSEGSSLRRRAFPRTSAELAASQASRLQRLALYEQVQLLRQVGYSILKIARELGMSRGGVRTFYYAESFPERARHAVPESILDPYLRYLEERLAEGCENASQLWREIEQQGFPGTRRQVLKYVQPRRIHVAPTTPGLYRRTVCIAGSRDAASSSAKQESEPVERVPATDPVRRSELPSSKQLAWLMLRAPEALEANDRPVLQHIMQDAEVQVIYGLARRFVGMVQQQEVSVLDSWLDDCASSEIESVQNFARGIEQDYAAVRAALETSWSSGQTEGQVNRLKLLKRQMYGRASFDLLRLRVLHAA